MNTHTQIKEIINTRIKEVKIPLKTGEYNIFYPQVEEICVEIVGYLWWKKSIEKLKWYNLRREKSGKIWGRFGTDNDYGDVISCSSIEEAKAVFIEYYKQKIESTHKFYRNLGENLEEGNFVRFHPIE